MCGFTSVYSTTYHVSGYRVIPNQFNKSLHMTPSELDQSWYVCSTCGFMKPDKILLSSVVWLPGYGPLKMSLFSTLATTQILITSPFVIVLYNELYHIEA